MQDNQNLKKAILVVAVLHPLEALLAKRMAEKRGKNPKLYFALTLFIGFPVLLRLRKAEKVAAA